MSLADDLRALRNNNSQITRHDFLNSLSPIRGSCLHIFYEGKTDNGFYGSIVRKEINDSVLVKTYVCGNKDAVYKTREKLTGNYNKHHLLFFVDKDLDDIIPIDRPPFSEVHVTELYSIENYLIDLSLFSQACSELFKLNSGSEQIKLIENKFVCADDDFCRWIISIMAWVLCCKRLCIRANLNDINLSDMCEINDDMTFVPLKLNNDIFEYLSEKTGANVSIFNCYINSAINELSSHPVKSYVRGKFHIWLLIECIDKAKKALELSENNKIKLHFNINKLALYEIVWVVYSICYEQRSIIYVSLRA